MPVPKRSRKRKEDPEKADVAPEETPDAEVEDAGAADDSERVTKPKASAKKADEGDAEDKPAAKPKRKPKGKPKAAAKAKTTAKADDDADAKAEADSDAKAESDADADADAKAESDDDAKGTSDDDADAKAKAKEASRPKRRRGAAETTTRKESGRPVPRRQSDGAIQVRAKARYVRSAPRKARLVMDHIRGKHVDDARAILRHTPRAAATDISKLLASAIANAENNFELDPGDLKIDRAFVDEGPTIKRFRPRALGRATPIHKRTSHMTITLTTDEKG